MALVSRSRNYVTGDSLPADYYDADLDEIVAGVNSITNAQIASNAAIADSKISFSGSANTYPKANGSGGLTWGALTANNGFGFLIKGSLTVADEQSMKWPIPTGMTVTNIWHKTTSGTATIRIQTNTTDIVTGLSSSSSLTNTTSFSSTALTQGQILTLDVTATSSGVDLFVLVWVTTP